MNIKRVRRLHFTLLFEQKNTKHKYCKIMSVEQLLYEYTRYDHFGIIIVTRVFYASYL